MSDLVRKNYQSKFRVEDLVEKCFKVEELEKQIKQMHGEEKERYNCNRLTGAVYSKESEAYKIGIEAMELFAFSDSTSNIFPSVKKMQRDIIAFSREIMHGDEEVCGHLTTGGSDSIANAVLAHKFWGREVKGITNPNIVISHTTHLAFNRACQYYNIECRIVNYKNWKVDLEGI